jgi:hypothetical protein
MPNGVSTTAVAASTVASDSDRRMKIARDAHREYGKAGEQYKIVWQLLSAVKGNSETQTLSRDAVASLMKSKWVEAVQKAMHEYSQVERGFMNAVKVLKVRLAHSAQHSSTGSAWCGKEEWRLPFACCWLLACGWPGAQMHPLTAAACRRHQTGA